MSATPTSVTERTLDVSAYPHGRVPAQVREAQLLELAEQLFAEVGYRTASMDELARRAGVTKPMIYRLIGGKEQVFRAVVDRLASEMQGELVAAVGGETTWEGRLRAGITAFFRWVERHRAAWTMLVTASTGEVDDAVAKVRAADAVLIRAMIEQGAGEFGIELDPRAVDAAAHGLNGAGEAIARWAVDHPELGPEELAEWMLAFVLPGVQRIVGTDGPR